MARPKSPRRVKFMPEATYFKPMGIPLTDLKEVRLTIDELEAVRLVDFSGDGQEKAAGKMNVSQSTLQRILSSARKKIAKALVTGKAIQVKGGEVQMANGRGRGGPRGGGRGRKGGPLQAGPGGYCSCPNPKCDYQEAHQPGKPCYQQVCPECGSQLIRRRQGTDSTDDEK